MLWKKDSVTKHMLFFKQLLNDVGSELYLLKMFGKTDFFSHNLRKHS